MLYGVEGDKLYKGAPPANSDDAWLGSAVTVPRKKGWANFQLLFFDAMGSLYGVQNDTFYKWNPPSPTDEKLLGKCTTIGGVGWNNFKHLFFMADGELYGVKYDGIYKGPPKRLQGPQCLVGHSGWSGFKFLMSPLPRK